MLEVVIIFSVTLVICRLIQAYLAQRNLPPGPYGFPYFGYLPMFKGQIHLTLKELSKKYGSILSVRMGPELFVVANDYESMKDLLCPAEALDRSPHVFGQIKETGFVGTNGSEWEEQRKFSMQCMRELGLGRGSWQNMIYAEVPDFLEELGSYDGQPVDTKSMLADTISGNILSLLIGRRLEKGKDDEKIKIAANFPSAVTSYIDPAKVASIIPFLKIVCQYLKIGGYDEHWKHIEKFINNIVKDEVNKHKEKPECSNKDFINLYLDKMKNEEIKGTKTTFSDKNAIGNINSLYLGGSETILTSLEWLFGLMAAYPDIQKRVHLELDDVIGRDGQIAYEDRFKIPYTFAVLMEAQRYSTIVPVPAPREARATFQVRGYTIPKGAKLFPNFWAIHRDAKYFEDPEQFIPERFLVEDGKRFVVNPDGYAPFSIGKRNCPGETIAWMEIIIFFTSVMQNFTIKSPPNQPVKLEGTLGIIRALKPQEFCFIKRTD